MKKINVYADMAADLFHAGHVNFLKNAIAYFPDDEVFLTVVLHTDEQIFSYKKNYPVVDFESRKEVLLACVYVDAVMQAPDEFDEAFVNQFDYLVHGDDLLSWDPEIIKRYYTLVMQQNKLITIPYTKGISSSQLKHRARVIGIQPG